jgi:electron transfer flavoprotein beta subunit
MGELLVDPSPINGAPIVVCMKWVALRPVIDPITGIVESDERWSGPSLADQAALELGLQLAASRNTTCTVITLGGIVADSMLRDALAAGATSAVRIHVDVDNDHQPTSASTAASLAAVIKTLDPALVLCGDWSLDRGSASVPSFLAAELSIDAACGLVALEQTSPGELRVERRLDGGRREVLAVRGPAVLSVEGATARLRRAPISGVLAASKATINVVPASSLEWEPTPARIGPFRPRARILEAPVSDDPRKRVEQLTGALVDRNPPQRLKLDPEAAADKIIEQLQAWGQLA